MSDLDNRAVLSLGEVDRSRLGKVGGKAARLGELSRIDGVRVPEGFCVTADAFERCLPDVPAADERLAELFALRTGDGERIRALSAELRADIENVPIPDDLAAAITARIDDGAAYAVRSSASAEDLPTTSFAGQLDSYLGVVGGDAVLAHVRRCWASLLTERAVTYRLRGGFDRSDVRIAVIVQRMVDAEISGVLFTADPVTSNRHVTTVEAIPGLGDALVSGRVAPDVFRVRDGRVVDTVTAGDQPVLTDEQALRLATSGRRIESAFGAPQDVEWCLAGDEIHIVQSRPITTLYPIPESDDGQSHVYVSFGHQQMMTDAMTPLGLSVMLLTTPAPVVPAGGRLFVDVTRQLASPATREGIVSALGDSDPLIGDALRTVLARDDFLPTAADAGQNAASDADPPAAAAAPSQLLDADPSIVNELVASSRESIAALTREMQTASGPAVFDVVTNDLERLRDVLFGQSTHLRVINTVLDTTTWLTDTLESWLGEKGAVDTLTQSAPGNVTSEMGLALLDVADAIRPHPQVVEMLRDAEECGDDDFLERLPSIPGGSAAAAAIRSYLDSYGVRCVGEIDITRPRWSEQPTALLPAILANVSTFDAGESTRRFERGLRQAREKRAEVLQRLRGLPGGDEKADETAHRIDVLRTFLGYREYPKFDIVSRYFVYKQALLAEADRLVHAGVLHERDDAFFLTFAEFREAVRRGAVDHATVRTRREEFATHRSLTPPRVLTSEGEIVTGAYRRADVPDGALLGLPVSTGAVEGRARVVTDMAEADLAPGDILVTSYTDPSWTPVFVSIAALVTEVGGQMTHGAVVAREYGLPAVVGVERATQLIGDGQRIRVDGTHGHVEIFG